MASEESKSGIHLSPKEVAIVGGVGLGLTGLTIACTPFVRQLITATPVFTPEKATLAPGAQTETAVAASASAMPTKMNTPIPPTESPAPSETSTPVRLPSYFIDVFYGLAKDGVSKLVGKVPLNPQNPTELNPTEINTFYNAAKPELPAGFAIDADYLRRIFNAKADESGILKGAAPDGRVITQNSSGIWTDMSGNIFVPFTSNRVGKVFGAPVLNFDKIKNADGTTTLRPNGTMKIVDQTTGEVIPGGGESRSMWQTPAQVVRDLGFTGDYNKIAKVDLDPEGNMVVFDKDGGVLARLAFYAKAVPSTATPAPTVFKSETPVPPKLTVSPSKVVPSDTPVVSQTPGPSEKTPGTPGGISPEVAKFLSEQKAPYTTDAAGNIIIDRYDTPTKETISIKPETMKVVHTTNGLDIITGIDTATGKTCAVNPEKGWFEVPEVQMDYKNLAKYTEVEQDFIEDGRANITTALEYAKNPTISKDAVSPQYWANYGGDGGSNFVYISYKVSTGYSAVARLAWPKNPITAFKSETKPFDLKGFYKVKLKNGESVYVVARTLKNATPENKDATINLFTGFNKSVYEEMANTVLGDGTNSLEWCLFDIGNRGGDFFAAILAPPAKDSKGNSLGWNPDLVKRSNAPNPTIARLQERGELISLFDPTDQKNIMDVLSMSEIDISGQKIPLAVVPITSLPPKLSRFILLPGTS